ncbi:MAG: zinc ribbon domain-containing protein [Planctomycetes bacterium]|nr:zinc ribbon domain-containing protein [Planctomycetota bacterium]
MSEMPIFAYTCPDCDVQFDALIRFDQSADCPECGCGQTVRQLSAPATHGGGAGSLPVTSTCPPSDAPPCSPHCCRLP